MNRFRVTMTVTLTAELERESEEGAIDGFWGKGLSDLDEHYDITVSEQKVEWL